MSAQRIVRSGAVALVGRTNVGKSTLLNAALRQPLAIVSRKPQTTRLSLLGVVRHGDAEIELLDTPGLHQARTRLGHGMNARAREAAESADVVVLVAALPAHPVGDLHPHPDDLELLGSLPEDRPIVLVLNKVDLLRDKRLLLPLLDSWQRVRPLAALVPISALRADGVERVLDEVARLLPDGPARHDADDVTDRPMRFFAAEFVREPILEATSEEVPHAVAVSIERYLEPATDDEPVRIQATIHVERPGQKAILVGRGGSLVGRIRRAAQQRLGSLAGRPVALELWVRVTPNWRDRPDCLAELGYAEGTRGGSERSGADR